MTLLPVLEESVQRAAARRCQSAAGRATQRWRWPARAIAITLGAVLATGTALAASGVWSPPIGSERIGHAGTSTEPLPAEQLVNFAVLRRAATPDDHDATVLHALRYFGSDFTDVDTGEVRLLSSEGPGYILVPAETGQLGGASGGASHKDALCLVALDPVDGAGVACHDTAEALAGDEIESSEARVTPDAAEKAEQVAAEKYSREHHLGYVRIRVTRAGATAVAGLVPDRVASVTVTMGETTQSVPVNENFFLAQFGPGPAAAPTVQWFDASGREIAR